MNKKQLLEEILSSLETIHQQAIDAALQAYDTATDDENIAENKYDTLGLEASYLAHGQSQRVAECEADIKAYKLLSNQMLFDQSSISSGALIHLMDDDGKNHFLFLGPGSGGLSLEFEERKIKIITPSSPIGTALSGLGAGDEIELSVGGSLCCYKIIDVS